MPYSTANDEISVGVAMPNMMPPNKISGISSGNTATRPARPSVDSFARGARGALVIRART